MAYSKELIRENLSRATKALGAADALLICAGAGMGIDSGLPDFRGPEGFWRAYPALARLGLSFEEMANPSWFAKDPRLAWAFYGHRLRLYRNAMPHSGFQRLLEFCAAKAGEYFVFTSNVDGQFRKAGFDADRIVECHGSIHHLQCAGPCCAEIWEALQLVVEIEESQFRALGPLPKCKNCSELARPNILMFGDWLWQDQRTADQQNRMKAWLQQVAQRDLRLAVIELGAGLAIPTVRNTAERICERTRGTLIRVNPLEGEAPEGSISLPLGAAEAMGFLAQNLPYMLP